MSAPEVQNLEQIPFYPVLSGAPAGQDVRILADQARALMPEDRVLVHVALDDTRLALLAELLGFFAPDVEVVSFPAWDCLPYDRVSPNGEIVAQRVAALNQMLAWDKMRERAPRIVLTTVNAITQKIMPRGALESAALSAKMGERLDMGALQQFLSVNGYVRADTVREAGEFAIRGSIVDLFPPGYAKPVRLDLFGDEIESIRAFDPLTQRSEEKLSQFMLQPVSEFFMDDESISRFRAGYREAFGVVRSDDPLYEAITEGRRYNGVEHWLPLFYEGMDTLFDYAPKAGLTLDHHAVEAVHERHAQITDFYQARQTLAQATAEKRGAEASLSGAIYHPLPAETLYLTEEGWDLYAKEAQILSPFAAADEEEQGARLGRDFGDIRALPDGDVFGALKDYIAGLPGQVLIAAYSEGSKDRLKGLLEQATITDLKDCHHFKDIKKLKPAQIGLCVLGLEQGFVAPDLAVITEQDILGDRLTRRATKRKKAENFLKEVSALSEGDLVVHVDHGVGKFTKLETLKAAGKLHDCLQVEYAGGDKLYVPVENIEVLSRFGGDEGTVQLDKLGGAAWQARKAKVKKDLMEMAGQLMDIAAARELRQGERLQIEEGLYNEFAARFPYAETEDQDRAIREVIGDLASGRPMDRLVCGDVGFGKTEVAIRAAYVAAMTGVQVALVVPTTLLARQHYQNFAARFANTSIRVDQLSRLVSAKDSARIKESIREGKTNIVIGTHALLSESIKFDHLGLLIVDEEQRFGVKQKERLKALKNDVHILTLSATPIPRTLQMSLTGLKEMSLITTPPVDRLAIRSFVLPFDPVVIREALLREHYRGGQSFYVCPRIKDMDDLEKTLKELVPEIKVIAAHGQMSATDLEERMNAFYDGQYDVLLATNIIESGIDIPRANTMIVHRADMFGLSQLYQIRGRIGRSKVRAYAYLTYPPRTKLNAQAQKRLEVMETLDTLGSGFQLASHDMDIRGAGNLLGEQQSGHVREVGVELYQQMLEEAVAAAKSGTDLEALPEVSWSPQINLGLSVLIPENYVEDLGIRMSLYRRLGDLHEAEDIESFAAELIDRFGKLPEEVENLLHIVEIKQLCKKACVDRVDAGPKGILIGFYKDTPPAIEPLMGWVQQKRGKIKLRPDQKLVLAEIFDCPTARLSGVRKLMSELAGL